MTDFKLGVALALMLCLNILDGVFTLIWIRCELAVEANPIMALVVSDPILFMLIKLTLVTLGALLLWRTRRRRFAVIAAVGCLLAYMAIFAYHMSAIEDVCADALKACGTVSLVHELG